MTRSERELIRNAIALLMNAHEDGFDRAMRILMPMVGMRRSIWDLDGAPSVNMADVVDRSGKPIPGGAFDPKTPAAKEAGASECASS